VVVNGVDTAEFSPRNHLKASTVTILGNLARLHAKNDQACLLRALGLLANRNDLPSWSCLIGGEGPERLSLERLCAELGLESVVHFVGHVSSPSRFLSEIDVYAQSSVAEGLPNAVLEAMATGLPVVATAVGGTPEVVRSGETGLLVPADDPAALAEALSFLLVRPDVRAAMGAAGRARVESQFSVHTMVQETEGLLLELTGARSFAH
jgi:glycosyltransferase involved in cell wall biosynthesis